MRKNTEFHFWTLFKGSIFLAVLFFLGHSCQQKPRDVSMAFYHWKTNVDTSVFKNIKKEKIYLRLFDVDWDEASHFPKPLAELQNVSNFAGFKKIVPVVFLTNKTFTQIIDYQIDTLALRVFEKVRKNTDGTSRNSREGLLFDEIQFDCDWTATTKTAYFSFLKKIKKLFSDKKISATIRLHQIKFMGKTGIPPVDRGMLMAYNMGNLDDLKTDNSILNIETLKSYRKNFDLYPLELDVALPIFSWGIVFRDGEAVKIINGFSKKEILETPQYSTLFQQNSDNRFVLLKNQYIKGFYLYENDEIRLEDAPLSNLQAAATFLSQNIKNQKLTVAFYHLDSAALQKYKYEDLENIVREF
jgi:hypothetical protein